MGSVVLVIIIIYLIKKGMIDKRGFSDAVKVFGSITLVLLIISLLTSPMFWGVLALGIVALIVAIIGFASKYSGQKRNEMYGWNSAEYQAKYAEAVAMFKEMYKNQRDPVKFSKMNSTERKVQELKEEKEAREAAGKYVDEEFTKKYGTNKEANMNKAAAGSTAPNARPTAGQPGYNNTYAGSYSQGGLGPAAAAAAQASGASGRGGA